MIKNILVFILSCIFTFGAFGATYAFKPFLDKHQVKLACGYKLHHSLLGITFIILGIIFNNNWSETLISIGLGIYIGHTIEEIYFNKLTLFKALTTFITKWK